VDYRCKHKGDQATLRYSLLYFNNQNFRNAGYLKGLNGKGCRI